ncbi:EAL domain-containing protein [Pseudomonas sp. CC6-YY-74]|uniref:EAL domain-containing protein n=1 Tax=Pseudomonas sp. CC6-YY-74 TaxID=1930532 RepID=UPI00211575B3|nr:GGDEF domain-containing phosphodiesterase [Pseudomonas sp. CC6-YY-74]
MRRAVEEEGFAWDGSRHGLTLSIGVVEAADQHDVSNLFCDLQAACNIAKEAGRNRVHCFDRAADDDRIGLQAIAARIDDIVERENLSLRVQQIAPAAPDSSELPHYELLLVMQNELLLQDFIAAAERYHRMTKVDRWVLTRIFSELERHPQLWTRCSSISINLSGSSLNDDRLLGFIESLFERYAVDPRNICFELTETAAVANLAKTADLVRHLQRAGCTFAIDDFGVGFSSFDYLKRLPVDYVKIDGSFVKEIERSPSDLAMVRSINEVAHALGRRTIAEYVETPSIRALLAEMGVDYVQGFGVQKPRGLGDWLSDEALLLCPS